MLKVQKPKTKLHLLIGLLILAVLCGAVYYFFNSRSTHSTANPTVNYGPPTKQDAQSVNDNKQRIVQRDQSVNSQPAGTQGTKRSLKPVITYADQSGTSVEVGGYIGVFENDGTCTATFAQGSTTLTRSVTAVRDVSSTDCPAITIDSGEFNPKGQYSVTLSYDSATTSGVSDPKVIEVK